MVDHREQMRWEIYLKSKCKKEKSIGGARNFSLKKTLKEEQK